MREGWVEVRLGEIFDLDNTRLGKHAAEPPVLSLSKYDGVVLAADYFDKRIASTKLDEYKTLPPWGWAYSTIHIDEGSIARNELGHVGVLSPMYTTMRWAGAPHCPEFFALLLRSPVALAAYTENAQGTVNRRRSLTFKRFADIRFGVPPLDEQRRMVDLIKAVDRQTANAEAVAASAANAWFAFASNVIRSGSTTVRLDSLVEVTMGRQRSPKNATGEHMVPYMRAANVKDGYLALDDVLEMNFSPAEQSTFRLVRGDVLVTEGCGSIGQLGASAAWGEPIEGPVCMQNTLLRLRARPKVADPDFVAHLARFAHHSGLWASIASGTNIFHIGSERAKALEVPSLSLSEQKSVAASLGAIEDVRRAAVGAAAMTKAARDTLLADLLSGNHKIPSSYDALLDEAVA